MMGFDTKRAVTMALRTTELCGQIQRALGKGGVIETSVDLTSGIGTLRARTPDGQDALTVNRPADEIAALLSALVRERRP